MVDEFFDDDCVIVLSITFCESDGRLTGEGLG